MQSAVFFRPLSEKRHGAEAAQLGRRFSFFARASSATCVSESSWLFLAFSLSIQRASKLCNKDTHTNTSHICGEGSKYIYIYGYIYILHSSPSRSCPTHIYHLSLQIYSLNFFLQSTASAEMYPGKSETVGLEKTSTGSSRPPQTGGSWRAFYWGTIPLSLQSTTIFKGDLGRWVTLVTT